MTGHLDLVCGLDAAGQSALVKQSFSAPMHIGKSHRDGTLLVVNTVNSTAGLFSGDRIDWRVRVEPGAELLLTSPSANRLHRMPDGIADIRQQFDIAAGGSLEVWPHLLIPQAGSRCRQNTQINIEPGANLILFELLAPGRVASGESFSYDWLDWTTDIRYGGKLIVRERYRLSPQTGGLLAAQAPFETAYFATCFVFTNRIQRDASVLERIAALHRETVWIGCSRANESGHVIKVAAGNSLDFTAAVTEIRTMLGAAMRNS